MQTDSIGDFSEFVTFSSALSLCGPHYDGLESLSTPEIASQELLPTSQESLPIIW